MPTDPLDLKPVKDSVPRIDNQIAVGEDLKFQRKWWRFERIVWTLFALVLVADFLGAFGRGWLAKAQRSTADGALHLRYERIERASTPSVMNVQFGPQAVHDGNVRLFVSKSVLRELGAQRIIPQPSVSTVGDGGVTYSFPANGRQSEVDIALRPSFPGIHKLRIQVPGSTPLYVRIAVLP